MLYLVSCSLSRLSLKHPTYTPSMIRLMLLFIFFSLNGRLNDGAGGGGGGGDGGGGRRHAIFEKIEKEKWFIIYINIKKICMAFITFNKKY